MFTEETAPVVEVFPGRGRAEEHLGRDPVMNGPATRLLNVQVIIRQRGVFIGIRQMLRKRITGNRLLRRFGKINILRDILNIAPVIHPSKKELLGVTEDDGANARVLKPAVLLNDTNDPGGELGELSVEFADELLATGNIQSSGNFLEDDSLPCATRERDDVLASVIRDEKSREFL